MGWGGGGFIQDTSGVYVFWFLVVCSKSPLSLGYGDACIESFIEEEALFLPALFQAWLPPWDSLDSR